MTIHHNIRDEKLQYNINKEPAKISALPSAKIDKYHYLTSKEILPSDQSRIIAQAMFTYSPLGKAFEKQIKTKRTRKTTSWSFRSFKPEKNQELKSIEGLFPKEMRTSEIKNEKDEIKK